MISKADLLNLRSRIKNNTSITQFCTCYVDSDKQIIQRTNQKFMNMSEADYFKWMDILKKIYVPKQIYNKNLYLKASEDFEEDFYMDPITKGKFTDGWLEAFYQKVITYLETPLRYIIILWLDNYDILNRTKDGNELDESEEVYRYIQCAICPVELDAAGLAFKENTFESKERDWVVKNPKMGFIYPALRERTAQRDEMIFFTADTKVPDWYFVEYALGMTSTRTTDELKDILRCAINQQIDETKVADKIYMKMGYRCEISMKSEEILTPGFLKELLITDKVDSHDAQCIAEYFAEYLEGYTAPMWQFGDKRLANAYMKLVKHNKKLKLLDGAADLISKEIGENKLTDDINELLDSERFL